MVSGLADGVGRIVPFVYKAQEQTIDDDDVDLLNSAIRKLFDLAIDTAEFICDYVHRSPLSTSIIVFNDSNSDCLNRENGQIDRICTRPNEN